MRTVVIAIALYGCSTEPAAKMRPYRLRAEHGNVVAWDACPSTAACYVALPFVVKNWDSDDVAAAKTYDANNDTAFFAQLPGGTCRERPVGCRELTCLGHEAECPVPTPYQTRSWSAEVHDRKCRFTPQRLSSISPKLTAYEIACPAGYDYDSIIGVERAGANRCKLQYEPEEDCPPTASCDFDEGKLGRPLTVECPPR